MAQTSLMQLSTLPRVPEKAKKIIVSFLQEDEPLSALMQDAMSLVAAPEAKAFESKSGGVIEMVTNLGEKFNDEKDELEKQESTERHTYEMMAQELTDQIEGAVRERAATLSHKKKREGDKATAEGELSDTSATLAADEKFLADLTSECQQKTVDF